MSLQIPIVGDLTGLQAALRNVPGIVGNALQQANTAGSSAFGGLFSGLRSTVTNFAGFMRSSIVNAVAGVGIVQAFRSTIQQLDRVGDLSQRFGVSADSLQRLGGVAELSGSSMDAMAKALSRLGRTIAEALDDPASQAAEKFSKLGINVESLRGKGIEEVFNIVRQNISELSTETEQGAAAFDFFGKAGEDIRNVVQLLADEFDKLRESITVASDESVAAAQNIDDAFKTLGQQANSSIGNMLTALRPAILFVLDGLAQMALLARIAMEAVSSVASGQGLGSAGLAKANQELSKFNEKQIAQRLAQMSDKDLEEMSKSGDSFSSLRAGAELTNRRFGQTLESKSVGDLRGSQADYDVSLPQPQRDKGDAIRARIDDLLSSERGISPARIIADSLAQIGGGGNVATVGRSDEEQKRLLSQQLAALQKIETNTRDLDAAALR